MKVDGATGSGTATASAKVKNLAALAGARCIEPLEHYEAGYFARAVDETSLRANRDRRNCFAEHRYIECVVSECGVERRGAEHRAKSHDLSRPVRDRSIDVGEDDAVEGRFGRRCDVGGGDSHEARGGMHDAARRCADEAHPHTRGPCRSDDFERLVVQTRPERDAFEQIRCEGLHRVDRPTSEGPRHDLADAFLGESVGEVGSVDAMSDLDDASMGLDPRRACFANEWLEAVIFDTPAREEAGEEVLPDIPRPQRAVSIEDDRATGDAGRMGQDAFHDLANGRRPHAPSIHREEPLPSYAMDRGRRVRVSKLLSWGLRHEPSAFGIVLDDSGWVGVEDVLAALDRKGERVTRTELEEVIMTSDKQRFALSTDGARVRANQGHSVQVDLGLAPTTPPETLFHGTTVRVEAAIRREGLRAGERTHVHLSADLPTAEVVARRRAGPHVVLRVQARAMHDAGRAFFLSENGVWLTEHVPPEFLD